ncbi:hypothetical protein GcM3_180037 [Golovinomyces cichoracearum]|uniref:Retrotransposon gag domain-containing protein n=1 Tax=Golovinomyces cichoracearum TaxID=62708 RepID=A0A420HMK6_9PEZI|nr:hypothetical protein GcM3_180037 [Golovinomyces cichoracearum]
MSKKWDHIIKESITEGLDELEMAERKNIFGDVAGAKRPSLFVLPIINVTPFSGRDQDAGRWIAVLESKFHQAGFDSAEDIPGWMWVKAVWMNTTTDAAMWMDSTPHIRKITNKVKARRPSEISDLERDVFTDEFQQKMVNELRHDKDESLREYFSRAQGILKIIGVDDNSEYRGVASSVNKFMIEMIVNRFVLRIYDEKLSARAVDRGAASSKSLHQAFEVIQGCQITMSDQVRQNEMWQQMHKAKAFDLIQENPAEVKAVVDDLPNSILTQYEQETLGGHMRLPESLQRFQEELYQRKLTQPKRVTSSLAYQHLHHFNDTRMNSNIVTTHLAIEDPHSEILGGTEAKIIQSTKIM